MDRRNHELRLTGDGNAVMRQMREIGSAHQKEMLNALTAAERRTLGELLAKLAASYELVPDVHPGYRTGHS